jgi:hypothetical protein
MTNSYKQHFNAVAEGANGDMYVVAQSRAGISGLGALCLRYDSLFSQLTYDFFDGKNDEECLGIIRTTKGYALIGYTSTYGNITSKEQNVLLVILNKPDMSNHHFMLLSEYNDKLSPVNMSVLDKEDDEIMFYPNPVKDYLHFKTKGNFNEMNLKCNIKNALGLGLRNFSINSSGRAGEGINIQDLPQGIYYLEIYKNELLIGSGKIIRE